MIRFVVVWRCIRGRNPSKTFSTIRGQRFTATECLRMDRKIQKWPHNCYAWRKRYMRGSLLSQKQFFSEDIKKLVQRWKKCIEKQGLYVEKWCYYKFSIFIDIKFVSVVRITIGPPTYVHHHLFHSSQYTLYPLFSHPTRTPYSRLTPACHSSVFPVISTSLFVFFYLFRPVVQRQHQRKIANIRVGVPAILNGLLGNPSV